MCIYKLWVCVCVVHSGWTEVEFDFLFTSKGFLGSTTDQSCLLNIFLYQHKVVERFVCRYCIIFYIFIFDKHKYQHDEQRPTHSF